MLTLSHGTGWAMPSHKGNGHRDAIRCLDWDGILGQPRVDHDRREVVESRRPFRPDGATSPDGGGEARVGTPQLYPRNQASAHAYRNGLSVNRTIRVPPRPSSGNSTFFPGAPEMLAIADLKSRFLTRSPAWTPAA